MTLWGGGPNKVPYGEHHKARNRKSDAPMKRPKATAGKGGKHAKKNGCPLFMLTWGAAFVMLGVVAKSFT